MIKPPDNLNSKVNDQYRRSSYCDQRNNRQLQHAHCPRRHHPNHCSNRCCNEQLHQRQQYQSEKIYQNCKYYPYRTWKWLQYCRIAYPSPYSGPGPGPGSVTYPDIGTMSMLFSPAPKTTTTTIPVVSSALDCPASSRQTGLDDSVIILSPSLLVPSKWIKSRRRSPIVTSIAPTTTTISEISSSSNNSNSSNNNKCKHQNNFCQTRQNRKSWMLGRKVWWLLFVLACFDNGHLLVNCRNSTSALVKLTTMPTMPRDIRSHQKHLQQHTGSNFKLNVSVNVNNAHNKFLNNNNNNNNNNNDNAYNNRNDIIKNSNNNAYTNFKYSTNDYKNLLISYNDIYTNNNGNYSTNLYYNANNSEFDTSNRKFSYSRGNNKSTSNHNSSNINNNNNNNNNNSDKKIDLKFQLNPTKIDSSNSNHHESSYSNYYYNEPVATSNYNNNNNIATNDVQDQLASLSSLVLSSKQQQKSLHSLAASSSLISTVISQKTDSMKASLKAINSFKAANTITTSSNKSPPVIKFTDEAVAAEEANGESNGYADDKLSSNRNRLMERLDADHTSKSLKNKRTIDTSFKLSKQVHQQQSTSERSDDDGNDDDDNSSRHYQQEQHRHQFNQNNALQKQQQQQHIQHYYKHQHTSNFNNEYSTQSQQQQMLQGKHHDSQRQRDLTQQQQYHYDHQQFHNHHQHHHHHHASLQTNPIHEQQQYHLSPTPVPSPIRNSIKPSYSNSFPYGKQNIPLDENYKRSILASISCPNCVYNIESYLASELFAPSILSTPSMLSSQLSSEQMLQATSIPQSSSFSSSPLIQHQSQLSSSSSALSSSSSNAFKRYHNINDQNNQAKSTFHQYQQQQQQEHQKQEQQQHQQSQEIHYQQQQQYPYHTVLSPQYYNNNNNNNNHFNSQPNPSLYNNNNQKTNYYNTIRSNSNFHQRFHQFDSDQIRLESIKHQILSKLGLKSKPNVTQTLPKQFIMETIYRAESSGRSQQPVIDLNGAKQRSSSSGGGDGAYGANRMRDKFRDSSSRSDLDGGDGNDGDDDGGANSDRDNAAELNEFFYNDNINTESVRNHLLPSSLSSPSLLTRQFNQFKNGDDGDDKIQSNIESDRDIYHNKYYSGGYNSIDSDLPAQTPVQHATSSMASSSAASSQLSSAPSQTTSAEQDDFYGRTKEIITFAEMGDVLNGHRLIEFSSLSDQMTGQNLRIRAASMWIRADLRPIIMTKQHDRSSSSSSSRGGSTFTTNRLKSSANSNVKVKLWVFRLIEPYANSWNSTKFAKKNFDEITTLSTTLNVQVSQLGWQKLDVTETVQNWYTNDRNLKLRLLVDCSGCGDRVTLHLFDGNRQTKSWHEPSKSSYNSQHYSDWNNHHHHHNHHQQHHHHHNHHHHRHHLQSTRKHGHNQKYRHVSRTRVHHRTSKNRTGSVPVFAVETETQPRLSQDQDNIQHIVYRNETRSMSSRSYDNSKLSGKKKTISTIPRLDDQQHPNRFSTDDSSDWQKVDPNRPFLVINTEPNAMKRVRRRALDCAGALNGQCCKESFYVSFKALGWDDWIIAPHGYFANYCRGDCAGPRTPDTYQSYHTHVMEEFRKLDRLTGMQPCCAPLKFSSMSLIYYGKEGIIKRDLPKMVVDECGCP